MTEPEPKVEAMNQDNGLAEGRREWTIRAGGPTNRVPWWHVLDGPDPVENGVEVRVVEVGVSPEEGPKFSKSELAQGSPVYREGWQDGYEAGGGLSVEEIEALIAAAYWAVEDWRRDLLHGDESGLGRPRVEAAESARAKLRAYLGGTDG